MKFQFHGADTGNRWSNGWSYGGLTCPKKKARVDGILVIAVSADKVRGVYWQGDIGKHVEKGEHISNIFLAPYGARKFVKPYRACRRP